jgi:hypothetical protein
MKSPMPEDLPRYRLSDADYLCAHCGRLLWREDEKPSRCNCERSTDRNGVSRQDHVTRATWELIQNEWPNQRGNRANVAEILRTDLRRRQAAQREGAEGG